MPHNQGPERIYRLPKNLRDPRALEGIVHSTLGNALGLLHGIRHGRVDDVRGPELLADPEPVFFHVYGDDSGAAGNECRHDGTHHDGSGAEDCETRAGRAAKQCEDRPGARFEAAGKGAKDVQRNITAAIRSPNRLFIGGMMRQFGGLPSLCTAAKLGRAGSRGNTIGEWPSLSLGVSPENKYDFTSIATPGGGSDSALAAAEAALPDRAPDLQLAV
jgi:hypothetical protein